MSKAYRCDVCEKLFYHMGSSDGYGGLLSGIGLLGNIRPKLYIDRLDICPECAAPLRDYIKAWYEGIKAKMEAPIQDMQEEL